MRHETAAEIIKCLEMVKAIPESVEQQRAINAITKTLKDEIRENIIAFASIGESLGFDFVKKVLRDTKKMIEIIENDL